VIDLKAALNLVINSDFRRKIFALLVDLYKKSKDVDSMNICRCLIFLDRAADISTFFHDLLQENKEVRLYDSGLIRVSLAWFFFFFFFFLFFSFFFFLFFFFFFFFFLAFIYLFIYPPA
jgi:hypothetical protein